MRKWNTSDFCMGINHDQKMVQDYDSGTAIKKSGHNETSKIQRRERCPKRPSIHSLGESGQNRLWETSLGIGTHTDSFSGPSNCCCCTLQILSCMIE
jgi:hypothetical protein